MHAPLEDWETDTVCLCVCVCVYVTAYVDSFLS